MGLVADVCDSDFGDVPASGRDDHSLWPGIFLGFPRVHHDDPDTSRRPPRAVLELGGFYPAAVPVDRTFAIGIEFLGAQNRFLRDLQCHDPGVCVFVYSGEDRDCWRPQAFSGAIGTDPIRIAHLRLLPLARPGVVGLEFDPLGRLRMGGFPIGASFLFCSYFFIFFFEKIFFIIILFSVFYY